LLQNQHFALELFFCFEAFVSFFFFFATAASSVFHLLGHRSNLALTSALHLLQCSPLLTMESVDEHTYSPPLQVDFALIILTFDTKKSLQLVNTIMFLLWFWWEQKGV
jgi:hypothetical protein